MNKKFLTIKYWLLYIALPIFVLAFIFVYFVIPLVFFVIAIIILVGVGERGFRYWKKKHSKDKEN